MDLSDVEGWFDGLDLDPKCLGIALLCTVWIVISLFDDPFKMGMHTLPLFYRIVVSVLVGPMVYLICKKMLD